MSKTLGTIGKIAGIAAIIVTPFAPPVGAALSVLATPANRRDQIIARAGPPR